MRKLTWILAALLVPSLVACGGQGKGGGNKVLAKVNGDVITVAAFEKEAELQPPYVRPMLDSAEGRKQFLDRMITLDLLMREAVRRGMDRRADVRDQLDQARKGIVLQALLREVAEKAPGLSDEALRKYYDANQASFQVGDRVRVSHVLYKDRGKAEEAARRARKGEAFEGIIKDATASGDSGADLGFIEKGTFVKEFEAAAFSASPGSIVGPVKTMYGFHVLSVGARKAAGLQPFEEVKAKILSDLRENAQREAIEGLIADLKKRARIEMFVKEGPEAPSLGSPPGAPPVEESEGGPGGPAGGIEEKALPAGSAAPGGGR